MGSKLKIFYAAHKKGVLASIALVLVLSMGQKPKSCTLWLNGNE